VRLVRSVRAFVGRTAKAVFRAIGLEVSRARSHDPAAYDEDGLRTIHDASFAADPAFQAAYARGVRAGGRDHRWRWRVHVGVWAARTAAHLDGDFVECGVGHGALASSVLHALGWDGRRACWLFDTFAGLDAGQASAAEVAAGSLERSRAHVASGLYATSVEAVRANFAEWPNVHVVAGRVPDSLASAPIARVAFLHLDMNCAAPEVAALEHLWPRLVPGAVVLLDDYAYHGYGEQKRAMDAWASAHGVAILSIPTGQGLLLRPPA